MPSRTSIVSSFAVAVLAAPLPPQTGAAEHTLAAFPQGAWFLIDPAAKVAADAPQGLLVVLPGGNGSRDALPFVRDSVSAQAPAGFATVLVTAPKWQRDQTVVWPTA